MTDMGKMRGGAVVFEGDERPEFRRMYGSPHRPMIRMEWIYTLSVKTRNCRL
jgi:hypothetical protein